MIKVATRKLPHGLVATQHLTMDLQNVIMKLNENIAALASVNETQSKAIQELQREVFALKKKEVASE